MTRRNQIAIGSLAALGLLAVGQQAFRKWRHAPAELAVSGEFVVTNLNDDGPGSLRDAIFEVAGANGPRRITLPAGRIVLQSPLPPVVSQNGVEIKGMPGTSIIDASALTGGPVLDSNTPSFSLLGVSITNAPEQALLVRQNGLHVVDSAFLDCNQGIYLSENVDRLSIERSTFRNNTVGVFVSGVQQKAEIVGNAFSSHRQAGVWAVTRTPPPLSQPQGFLLARNHFEGDQISVVLVNVPALVEANEFVDAADIALYLQGEGPIVRQNRVRGGKGIGISAEQSQRALIEGNEIDNNRAIGVLVRSSGGTLVRNNRIHTNGYGVAFVFGGAGSPNTGSSNVLLQQSQDGIIVVGDSPVLQGNRILNSKSAALRFLDYLTLAGTRTPANPFLQENTISGNRFDEVVRGVYRAVPENITKQ